VARVFSLAAAGAPAVAQSVKQRWCARRPVQAGLGPVLKCALVQQAVVGVYGNSCAFGAGVTCHLGTTRALTTHEPRGAWAGQGADSVRSKRDQKGRRDRQPRRLFDRPPHCRCVPPQGLACCMRRAGGACSRPRAAVIALCRVCAQGRWCRQQGSGVAALSLLSCVCGAPRASSCVVPVVRLVCLLCLWSLGASRAACTNRNPKPLSVVCVWRGGQA
jgi:hypothetical protein